MSARQNSAARNRPGYDYNDDEELYYGEPTTTRPPMSRQATGGLPRYRVAGTVGPIVRAGVDLPEASEAPPMRPAARPKVPVAPARRQVAPPPAAYPTHVRHYSRPAINGDLTRWLGLGVAALIVLVGSYLLVSVAVGGWQNWQDDMTYGKPRLTRLEAKVGHNETGPNSKTLLLAQNLRGQISIIEIPGGDASKTRVIVGPQLFGKDKDLVPIKLTVRDVNGDSQPDLIASAQEQQLIYINENGNFRPINEQERTKLAAQSAEN